MDYKEAVKKVQATKPKENLMVIRLNYDTNLLVPHNQGVALLSALENAELLHESYGRNKEIKYIERDNIQCSLMSRTEYEQIKISMLLNVSLDEVKQHALTAS